MDHEKILLTKQMKKLSEENQKLINKYRALKYQYDLNFNEFCNLKDQLRRLNDLKEHPEDGTPIQMLETENLQLKIRVKDLETIKRRQYKMIMGLMRILIEKKLWRK